jgi:hypothetical protein
MAAVVGDGWREQGRAMERYQYMTRREARYSQSLKIFWSEASLGLRRGVVVGKIGMATSHLAVER